MPITNVHSWIIQLTGHSHDLEYLTTFTQKYDLQVIKREDENYYLNLPVKFVESSKETVIDLASDHLRIINGAARLASEPFIPVTLVNGYYGIDSEGVKIQEVINCRPAEFGMKSLRATILIDGVAIPDTTALSFLQAAKKSPEAANALKLLCNPLPTWPELYLIYEFVKSECSEKMVEGNWIKKNDEKLFHHTANSYSALGIKARHGKQECEPPKNPMDHKQAISIIRKLAKHWMHSIAS